MTTPDDTMEVVEIVARAIGDTLIPGSRTIKARVTVSHELIERMAAAIPAAIEASGWKIVPGWQPIETAPDANDPTPILVVGGRHAHPTVALPDGEHWRALKRDGNKAIPTFWQPLPASPKVTR